MNLLAKGSVEYVRLRSQWSKSLANLKQLVDSKCSYSSSEPMH